ncbi:MAG: M15 family metallopeptidase [Akkermansia sp.]|nr:M15 family metallopeptidase [Akkermansia sp.]
MKSLFTIAAALLFLPQCSPIPAPQVVAEQRPMPTELCYLDTVVPGIKVDLKYCGNDNFVGRPIDGYTEGTRAILRKDAALAVQKAQQELESKGLGLLIWDAYRPHRALADFYAWSKTADDSTRAEFYPNITKRGIYENRYIGLTSEHSWGIAVDLTIIDLKTGKELDMGGRHDLLDASSATVYAGLTKEQQANRLLLRDTMARAGMRNYSKEWWHYFLREPGLCTRHNFPLDDHLIVTP